jgi:uncharacterized protein
MTTFFYLHGWLSSPQSNKAQFFKQCFLERGIDLQIPDFNQNDFYHLTLTRQIQQVQALLPNSPVTIIGSSLGGLTALWLAQQQLQIQRLVLLAPALNFLTHCVTAIGKEHYAKWREQGEFALYHYHFKREILLSYDFIEDMQQYTDTELQQNIPTLILHGRFDKTIPIQTTHDFVSTRPWIQLMELHSDHLLTDVQSSLWQATITFCQQNP